MAEMYDIKEVRPLTGKYSRRGSSVPEKVFEDRPPMSPFIEEFYLFDPKENQFTDSFIVSAVDEMDAFVRGTKRIERYKK